MKLKLLASPLLEVSRKNLVGKTKVGSPERYNRRLRYGAMSTPEIDGDKLLNEDMLVIYVQVGKYTDIVAFAGVIKHFIEIVKRDPKHAVNRRNLVRAINEQVDLTDVFVNCSCPDMKYRYRYWADKYKYLYGEPEKRPAEITNPDDSIGAMCKHLTAILSNKKWLVKAASVVNDFIQDHYDEIVDKYKINTDEFILNVEQALAASAGAIKRQLKALPPNLAFITTKLWDPNNLDLDLFDFLDNKGWVIRVDEDLNKPVRVFISQDPKSLDDPENAKQPVYIFDVEPAGTKVRLVRVNLEELLNTEKENT